jgi:hypothetical protein
LFSQLREVKAMAAETKRVQPGLYLMFLGQRVNEDEIRAQMALCSEAATADAADDMILVVDTVGLDNPLKAARVLPPLHDERITHYIVVGSSRAGAVLAERLTQKLTTPVEVAEHQIAALDRAKAIRGTSEIEENHCDFLGARAHDHDHAHE